MSKYKSFETERLTLKPTSLEDAPFIFELLNTPLWLKFIGDRNVTNVKDAEDYIRNRMMPQLERLGYGNYTVFRKSDGVKVGTCGLYDREGLDGLDIGFAFLPAYMQQGYAFESSSKLKEAAVSCFGINQLSAITMKENFSSQKLLERLGLKFVKLVTLPNDDEELMLYHMKL